MDNYYIKWQINKNRWFLKEKQYYKNCKLLEDLKLPIYVIIYSNILKTHF